MPRREFQFIEGPSKKFWAIELEGAAFTVHFGRIGTAGQAQKKEFATPEAAKKEHDKLIAEKTRKGYTETDGAAATTPVPAAVVKSGAAVPRPRRAKAGDLPPDAGAVDEDSPATVAVTAGDDRPPRQARQIQPPTASTPPAPERRTHLPATEYRRAGWLPWTPLPEPPVEAFDLEKCLGKLEKVLDGDYFGYWSLRVVIPSTASPEEACFWITVQGGLLNQQTDFPTVVRHLRAIDFSQRPAPAEIGRKLQSSENVSLQTCGLLRALIDADAIADLILAHTRASTAAATSGWVPWKGLGCEGGAGFRDYVAPYLSTQQRSALAERLSRQLRGEPAGTHLWDRLVEMISSVGGSAACAEAIAALPDNAWASNWGRAHFDDLAGLPSAERFAEEVLRLVKTIRTPSDARLWLVATDWRSPGLIADAVCRQGSKADAEAMARVLSLVEAPEAALPMLRVQAESKAPAVALEWFARYPVHAAVGLAPVAAEAAGKLGSAARSFLDNLRRSGRTDVLEAALAHLEPDTAAFLQREVIDSVEATLPEIAEADLPAAMREALAGLKPGKPVPWLTVAALAPIRVGSARLGAAAVERVLSGMRTAALAEAAPVASALKSTADAGSLDAFVWSLFSRWQAAGGPSKDKWAMAALGHLGNDASVLKLVPLVREWPGESQHQRAVFGLEVLRKIGTDAALMGLNGIAQKVKFRGLKEKALALMEDIAASRGLTRDELADRIVPDCGLDAHGSRIFDFGPRQFRFVLGPGMKPLVRDAAGKAKPELPAPGKTDDPPLAEAAVAEWKLLKKTLRETLKVQADRLEDAMISGRRWSAPDFDALLVRHPLMVNLIRQLLWSAYGEDGRPRLLFRVTEDQTLADENDATVALPAECSVGIVHPAHLTDAQLSSWGQVFSDYEIIPPFQQLARRICRPAPDDLGRTAITHFAGPHVPGIVVYGMLERSHWNRDRPADAGGFMQHSKPFLAAGITAFIAYDPGMGIGYYEEPQTLREIYFVPGHIKPEYWGDHKNRLKVQDVDPVVLSEVLRLAEAIVSKAE